MSGQLESRGGPGPAASAGFTSAARMRLLILLACAAVVSGCAFNPFRRTPPRPGRTTIKAALVELPAVSLGNCLLIEAKWDRFGPYHFLVDTGSAVTLITPALARRYPSRAMPSTGAEPMRVRSAEGRVTELPPAWLSELELGAARFEDVPVLIYDCEPLSAHLGVRIDGVLGFPLFRELILTLDYPASRILLQPARNAPLTPGSALAFDDASKTPLIQVGLGGRSLVALVDSGSDAGFSLNPIGIEPRFKYGPRAGPTVGTIAGDRIQQIGRLEDTLSIGGYVLPEPVVDLKDELSSIGGAVLKHFAVTFDQGHDRVTFYRESRDPILTPPQRSAGVSFSKTPAYWKVVGVVRASPAENAGIRNGNLVTKINGEPVAAWDLRRYEQLVASGLEIAFTFLNGATESTTVVPVFELVP